jgi:Flp pilus assembly protein TadG
MPRTPCHRRQAGSSLVEFAIILPVFLLFVFIIMELARMLYMVNILQEVTRRAGAAAAQADFSDTATMDGVRRTAVFDDQSGILPLGAPISSAHVRIDYMSVARDAAGVMTFNAITSGALPTSPARNNFNCVQNPFGGNCISLVRVRICDPGNTATCVPVQYQPMFPLATVPFNLPTTLTLVPAGTLGYAPGMAP